MTNDGVGRPSFPKRAVVTAGMPYGNKELHFGHVGGVFVHADIFARFLRDRIGKENVIFVSGTDCYGATIEAGFEQAVANGFLRRPSRLCCPKPRKAEGNAFPLPDLIGSVWGLCIGRGRQYSFGLIRNYF